MGRYDDGGWMVACWEARQWIGLVVMALVMAGGVGGCDEKPDRPPAMTQPTTPAREVRSAEPNAPTTRQLLSAPRQRVVLTPLPLSVSVPPGWEVKQVPNTSVVFLQGPTPDGEEVHIQLARKETRWSDGGPTAISMDERVSLLAAGARKEQKDHPQTVKRVAVRNLGDAKVFEKQSISASTALTSVDDKGQPVVLPPQYRWTITVFVPGEKEFRSYELNFLNLSVAEYQASHEFLQGILDTLQLETGPATQP
jgi:hypothetical protein